MPFVQRVVRPKYLSRVNLHDDEGKPKIKDGELEAVTNFTLSSALRQLASVVLIANEIFEGLSKELEDVTERSTKLRTKINAVEEKIKNFDPRSVTVPEGDLTQFASRTQNFSNSHPITTGLFTPATRPQSVRNLYESAGPTPVAVMRLMDRYRRDGVRSSKFFSVTPVLGASRRKPRTNDIDIETRTPAMVVHLRRWTSIEAMGDVTAELDCTHKVAVPDDDVDHRLPSPEEQLQAVALKFPAEVIPVDVSGRTFNRMSSFRRSLLHVEYEESRRRGGGNKTRRTRGKRRNTIAGTDSKELAAIVGDSSDTNFGKSTPDTELSPSAGEKKSHLESLKEWGRSRLRLIRNIEPAVKLRERSASRRKLDKEEPTPHSSSGNWSASSESGQSTATSHHPRSSVSSGSTCQKHSRRPVMVSTSSSVTSESTLTPDDGETCSMYSCDTEGYYTSFHLDSGLKTLREEDPLPPLQSCSALSGSRGNNSTLTADSEYELFGKGSTSTTASSAGTVCTTLLIPPAPNVPERVNSQLTSSNKETSTQDRNVTVLNNLSNSRKDASNNKTDKKTTNKVDNKQKSSHEQKSNLTKENVLKLKSVDETCSTNMITVEVHHGGEGEDTPEKCGDSPDSGHNTCSSPVDSIASPSIDLEMSECSDLEGVDRMERIRVKTTINSSRIPSMCVITPPQSDDEVSLNALRGPVDIGDYVTIADVRSPPVLKREIVIKETEYVSLNELPPNESSLERKRKGARVTLDSEGKVVYSSDSLRRRKSVHTTGTFEPGPNVVASNTASPVLQHRVSTNIRPVLSSGSPVASDRLSPSSTNQTAVPATVLRQTNGSRSQSPLVSNGVQSNQTHTNHTATSNFNKECYKSAITESPNQRNNLSLTKSTAAQQYFPRSSYNKLSPKITGRPMSPLAALQQTKQGISQSKKDSPRQIPPSVFPNLKSLSPKMVVRAKQTARAVSPSSQRGAYVKVSDSPGSPEDDCKYLVKRSDSYRMANDDNKIINPNLHGRKQYGPAIVAGPSLLSAIQNSRNNKDQVDSGKQASVSMRSQQHTSRQQHARVPSDQINTPHQFGLCSSTPTKSTHNNILDFTTNLSPISHHRTSTPVPKSRTAMDLYAIIHESKKKINKLKEQNRLPVKSEGSSPTHSSPPRSSPTHFSPKPTATEGPPNWPKAIPTSHVPNFVNSAMYGQAPVSVSPDRQYQMFRKSPSPSDDYRQTSDYRYGSLPYLMSESTRNSPVHMFASPSRNSSSLDRRKYLLPSPDRPSLTSDRHGRTPTTSRNDFKQLLLRTNFGSNSISKSSAVERLKNKVPLSPKKSPSWKSDVLSSTIPEVCSEEDEQIQTPMQTIPVSSALVNQQNKAFTRNSPTLETAL